MKMETTSSPATITVAQISKSVDGIAALEFLGVIQDKFQFRPWPASRKELKKFLAGLDDSASPTLAKWMGEFDPDLKPGKRRKEAWLYTVSSIASFGMVWGSWSL